MLNLVKGIVYIEFDDIKGTTPLIWFPNDLEEQLRILSGIKAISLLTGEENYIPQYLTTIPFPSRSLTGMIKFFKWRDPERRGGIGQSAFVLLFDNKHDAIFYKAREYLEKIFNQMEKKITELERRKADKSELKELIFKNHEQIKKILEELKQEELAETQEEFPSFQEEDSEESDFKLKTIICGDPRVGKTSLILRFTDSAFTRRYIPTLGVNISKKTVEIKGKFADLLLWDIAGQQKYKNTRIHFYKGSDVVFLVFDLTNEKTFKNIDKWYKDIKKSTKKQQINGFLVGNKSDLKKKRKISKNDALNLAEELGLEYLETSALTGKNIQKLFKSAAMRAISSSL
ncbi:MAG: GTP-binding protein [Promethearchaeota archaeon]|nr:MAG: GTP-binding protein [Candidatus Lokiarchaeota archaeon]